MSQQRRGLGKGLGALIPTAPVEGEVAPSSPVGLADPADISSSAEVAGGVRDSAGAAHFEEVPIAAVTPNPRQPRQSFDEGTLAELAVSIREVGLLQPIVVRQLAPGQYELVMGERRWRAAGHAELERIPAIVRDAGDDVMLRDALMENLHREQLNPLEEAAAYNQLLEDFGATHDELAARIGRSRPHITNTLRLMNLSLPVQRRVAAGVLSAGHSRALLTLEDAAQQDRLAGRIVAEGLSVRAVEEIIALGDAQENPAERKKSAKQSVAPGLRDLASQLSDHFETRVKVDLGKRKGKIVVEFASVDDLERIVAAMAPESASGLRQRGDGDGWEQSPTE